MGVEIVIIDKKKIPSLPWRKTLRFQYQKLQLDQALRVFLDNGQSTKPVLQAWAIIAKENKMVPFDHTVTTQIGRTVYLWTEKEPAEKGKPNA